MKKVSLSSVDVRPCLCSLLTAGLLLLVAVWPSLVQSGPQQHRPPAAGSSSSSSSSSSHDDLWEEHRHQSSAGGGSAGVTSHEDDSPLLPNCTAREAKRKYRYMSIQDEILRKLRLSSPPNITGRRLPAIPHLQTIMDKMCRQKDASCSDSDRSSVRRHGAGGEDAEDDDDDDYHATTIKVLLFPNSSDDTVTFPGFDVCQFFFQPDFANSEVLKANFSVYIRRSSNSGSTHETYILIYRLVRTGSERNVIARQHIFFRKISLTNDTGTWHTFNVVQYVKRWISEPTSNLGLIVQATDSRGQPLAVVEPRNADEEPYRPYLEIHVGNARQQPRNKRTTDLDCDDMSAEKHCCRYPLVVDFDSFGWDWVIVPRRYSAYYCSGECPFLYMQTHPHTHVRQQQQQQLPRPGAASGGPCCSPRRVSAISMLYYDEYMNIVYGRLPGMVVDQCGCA